MTPTQIGRYKIERMLGRGGMSSVYLAEDPAMSRLVAIKILPPEFLHHPSFRERFDREARIIAALEHPAILPIYDYGEADGLPYFIMRHMQGGSLTDRLAKGALSIEETATIVERIGSALDYAHSKGVIHRDLKPGNILFDQWGSAYLGDFGIARLEEAGATLTGSLHVGTPAYMSPEQVEGKPGIDGRTDIYALGIIIFESLTGSRPYHAETPSSLALKHILEPVPRILETDESLPPEADNIIYKAMAKKPDDRYATGAGLASDLSRLANKQPVSAPLPPPATTPVSRSTTDTLAAAPTGVAHPPGTATPTKTPMPSSTGQESTKKRRFPIWVWFAGGGLLVLCLAVVSVSLILASGDGLGGLLGGDATGTDTSTAEVMPSASMTSSPTRTPTMTSTPFPTATPSNTPTVATQQATPTLIPTFTATAETGFGSGGQDLPTATWTATSAGQGPSPPTSAPLPTSPQQPTSPPQPTSTPQSQPTKTPTPNPTPAQPTSTPKPPATSTPKPPPTATSPPFATRTPTPTGRESPTPSK